jgi:hypothetical protein
MPDTSAACAIPGSTTIAIAIQNFMNIQKDCVDINSHHTMDGLWCGFASRTSAPRYARCQLTAMGWTTFTAVITRGRG